MSSGYGYVFAVLALREEIGYAFRGDNGRKGKEEVRKLGRRTM